MKQLRIKHPGTEWETSIFVEEGELVVMMPFSSAVCRITLNEETKAFLRENIGIKNDKQKQEG